MDFSEYKGIYVIGALANGKIQKVTGELTGEARVLADQLGEEVAVVLIGADLKDPASSLIPLGADKVYVIDHPLLAHYDGKRTRRHWRRSSWRRSRIPSSLGRRHSAAISPRVWRQSSSAASRQM